MKKRIYTVSTAHLDTSWLWEQDESVSIYLPRTLKDNFEYFEQYPNYKFNFEGSYRYELIEEYHPEEFEKLKEYIKKGRWAVTGSCFENGDTNIPSPEALIRNVLYGNSYFEEKFSTKSNDIFLPDCFGFGKALPQIMTHCGLIGFSTGKLSWGSSIEPPFEIGKWKALDGSFVYTSIKPGSYSAILKELRCEYTFNKLDENLKSANIPFTMIYYGTGDRGGAPHKDAIATVFREMKDNEKEDSEIISSSMTEFFEELKSADLEGGTLLEFDKEFLMSTHGVGSYTSRAMSKRLNKKCENLLDVSEKANSLSAILGYKEFPQEQFDFAWKRVLEHHFHDDITGTSFMVCYKRNWNDYFLALNSAKNEYVSAIAAIEKDFDTSKLGNPIMVFNPVQDDRTSVVSVQLDLPYKNVKVVDLDNNEYDAIYSDNKLEFEAFVKGNSIKIFDIIEADKNALQNNLKASDHSLENERYKVTFDEEYNICSIVDKKLNVELLSNPIKYNLSADYDSIQWPAWEIKYSDIIRKPYGYFKDGEAKIIEDNALKVAIEINKTFNRSTLKEIVSLEKGSNRIDVYNELVWHEECSNLKVSFPLSVNSDQGTYDIGISKYDRPNNTEKLYEVPAQKFVKIEEGDLGITILSDSKQGFDKPTSNEIRMTVVHSPFSNYRFECSQHLLDFGLNIFSYSITSSNLEEDNSISEAEKFTKPLNAFKMGVHDGNIKGDLTLFGLSNNNARVMCFKKALHGDKFVLRVVDYYGCSLKDVNASFVRKIKSVHQIRGDEEILNPVEFSGNSFKFNLNNHEIKSFLIEFECDSLNEDYKYENLPFDKVGITSNKNRNSATLKNKISLPAELIKNNYVSSKSIKYKLNLDGYNALEFNNQEIKLDTNYKYAYLLVMSQQKDGEIFLNNKKVFLQNSFDRLGQWDMYGLKEYGCVKKVAQDFTFTHYHKNNEDQILKELYLYSIKVKIDSDTLILNENSKIALFALTYSNINNEIECNDNLIDTYEPRKFDFKFTKSETKYLKEPLNERIRDVFVDRRITKAVNWWGGHCYQSKSDFYQMKVEKKNFKRREKIKLD